MERILLFFSRSSLAVVALLLSACASESTGFPEGSRVSFPGEPEVLTDRVSTESPPASRTYIRQFRVMKDDDLVIFMASEEMMLFGETVRADRADIATNLMQAWDDGRIMPQFEIIDNFPETLSGGQGRTTLLRQNTSYTRSRFLINERHPDALVVATASVIGPREVVDGAAATAFLESLEFLPLPEAIAIPE